MALSYTRTTWSDDATTGTTITAARLNNIESQIVNLTSATNSQLYTSGGTITGNLAVNGSLTINDLTGKDTTYNVANELKSLKDSVSQDTEWKTLYYDNSYGEIKYIKYHGLVQIFANIKQETDGIWQVPALLPTKYRPYTPFQTAVIRADSNSVATNNVAMMEIWNDGIVRLKAANSLTGGRIIGQAIYIVGN